MTLGEGGEKRVPRGNISQLKRKSGNSSCVPQHAGKEAWLRGGPSPQTPPGVDACGRLSLDPSSRGPSVFQVFLITESQTPDFNPLTPSPWIRAPKHTSPRRRPTTADFKRRSHVPRLLGSCLAWLCCASPAPECHACLSPKASMWFLIPWDSTSCVAMPSVFQGHPSADSPSGRAGLVLLYRAAQSPSEGMRWRVHVVGD